MASLDRASIARQRLTKERKDWRKDHPPGFYARPSKTADGGTDLFKWEAGIPGKRNVRHAGFECSLRTIQSATCTDSLGGRRLQT